MSDASNFDFGKFIPGFDFLQSLVKGAGAGANPLGKTPQWVAPTVSIEEVDKRITELKAVQFWLEQNGRALAATIQALEVQRMTLSTLKGMNVSMSELAKSFSFPAMGAGEQKEAQDQAPQNVFSQAMDWTRAAAASAQDFSRWAKPQHTEGESAAATAAAEASDPTAMQAQAELFKAHATQAPSQGAEAAHKAQPQAEAAASSQEDAGQSTADAAKEVTEEMAAVQKAAVGQAMQWWGALTQQFQQIAAKAVAEPVSHQAMEAAQRAGDMASNLAKTAVQTATAATEKMVASGTAAVAKASANVQAASTAAANVAAHAGANVGAKSSKPAATQGAAKPAAKSAVKPVAKAAAKPAVKPDAKPAAKAAAKRAAAPAAAKPVAKAAAKTAKAVKTTVSAGRGRAKG